MVPPHTVAMLTQLMGDSPAHKNPAPEVKTTSDDNRNLDKSSKVLMVEGDFFFVMVVLLTPSSGLTTSEEHRIPIALYLHDMHSRPE